MNRVYEAKPPPKRKEQVGRKRRAFERKMPKRVYDFGIQLHEAMNGNPRAVALVREAVATPDFPTLFNQLTDYGMLGQYAELPSVWPSFASRVTVPDFRPQRLLEWDDDWSQMPQQNGGHGRNNRGLARIPELTEYPTFTLREAEQSFGTGKHGARFPFSFEAFRNDEFQVISDLPGKMAQRANETEDVAATSVLATETGPNPDFFDQTTDFGDLVTQDGTYVPGNPSLSIDGLRTAIDELTKRRVDGRMVTVQQWALVVPPSLEITARELTTDTRFLEVEPRGDGERRYTVPNVVSDRYQVVVNQYLPLIDQSENAASTWYLVPLNGTDGTRRAIVLAFMAGEETPDLRVSADTGTQIGGGDIDPMRGSFSHDDVQFRVRHIVGGSGLENAGAAVSLGTDGS